MFAYLVVLFSVALHCVYLFDVLLIVASWFVCAFVRSFSVDVRGVGLVCLLVCVVYLFVCLFMYALLA